MADFDSLSTLAGTIRKYLPYPDLSFHGPGTIVVNADLAPTIDSWQIQLDAPAAHIVCPGLLSLPETEVKRLILTAQQKCESPFVVKQLSLDLPDTQLTFEGNCPCEKLNSIDTLDQYWGKLTFTSQRSEHLLDWMPVLNKLSIPPELSGPVTADIELAPPPDLRWLTASVNFAPDSQFQLVPYFQKPDRAPLKLNLYALTFTQQLRASLIQFILETDRAKFQSTPEFTSFSITPTQTDQNRITEQELSIHSMWSLDDLATILQLSPWLTSQLQKTFEQAELSGSASLGCDFSAPLARNPSEMQLELTASTDKTTIALGDIFQKPAQQHCSFLLVYAAEDSSLEPYTSLRTLLVLDKSQIFYQHESSRVNSQDQEATEINLKLSDIEELLNNFPVIAKHLSGNQLIGQCDIQFMYESGDDLQHLEGSFDLTNTSLAIGEDGWSKPADMPCKLKFDATAQPNQNSDKQYRIDLDQFDATLAASSLNIKDAWAYIDADYARDVFQHPTQLPPMPDWPESFAANIKANLVFDTQTRLLHPQFRDWLVEHDLLGTVPIDLDIQYADDTWHLDATANAEHLTGQFQPYLNKADVLPVTMQLSANIEHAPDQPLQLLRTNDSELIFTFGDNQLQLDSQLSWNDAESETFSLSTQVEGTFELMPALRDVHQLERLFPPAAGLQLSGQLLGKVHSSWPIDTDNLKFDLLANQLSAQVSDTLWRFNGLVQCNNNRLTALPFQTQIGDAVFDFDLDAALGDQPRITFSGHSNQLDNEQLAQQINALLSDITERLRLLCADAQLFNEQDSHWPLATLTLFAERYTANCLPPLLPNVATETWCTITHKDNTIDRKVRGAYQGGLLEASHHDSEVSSQLEYTIAQASPSPELIAWLQQSFPGLHPTGPVSYQYSTAQAQNNKSASISDDAESPDSANQPFVVASGQLTIDGGELLGKAAPGWVTTVFPTLNLARFRFVRMHDWFSEYNDGTSLHRVIFRGKQLSPLRHRNRSAGRHGAA